MQKKTLFLAPSSFFPLFFKFCSFWFSCHGNTILGLVVNDLWMKRSVWSGNKWASKQNLLQCVSVCASFVTSESFAIYVILWYVGNKRYWPFSIFWWPSYILLFQILRFWLSSNQGFNDNRNTPSNTKHWFLPSPHLKPLPNCFFKRQFTC